MMNEKMAVVNELVACGYCLMNRTAESMAEDFDLCYAENIPRKFQKIF